MRPYRIVEEHPDHMLVHVDGEEKPFKVATGSRHHATVEKIRKYASGGEVKPADPEVDDSNPWFPDSDESVQPFKDALRRAASTVLPIDNPGASLPPAQQPAAPGIPDLLARPPEPAPASPPPPAPSQQSPSGAAQFPTIPSPAGKIASYAEEGAQALQQKGQAEQSTQTEIAGAQGEAATHLQDMDRQRDAMLAERNAHAERLFNDVMSAKIDPNHYWNSKTTGQKIAASIGLILGGIGAGLTKGPNYAVEIMQSDINRDLEAQRLNMGKSQTLLSHYMQQTRDVQTSMHLARADYLTAVAAQIAAATSKGAAQQAIPNAQAAIAQLRTQAAGEQQAATLRAYQIREAQINVSLSQQHATALGELLKGVSGGGGFDRRLLELPGMDKYRERSVDMPDGSVAFANDKEEANKANESMAGVAKVREKLARYRQLLESGNPATVDRTLAKAQRADILSEMGHLHSLSRLSDRDLKLFEDQVPDLTDFIKPNAGKRLDALGNSVDDVVWAYNKAILHRPNAKRPK